MPGAPAHDGASMDAIIERAVTDAASYAAAGIDGLIVENHGDVPFLKPEALGPETAAAILRNYVPLDSRILDAACVEAARVAGASHLRPKRPLPAVCRSVMTSVSSIGYW